MIIPSSIVKQPDGSWAFTWTGTGPFEIWLDGRLLSEVASGSYTFRGTGYSDAPPDLEIIESGETAQSDDFAPYAILQWRGVTGAYAYQIERYVGGVWAKKATLMEDGRGYYKYVSTPLPDCETTQWRVLSIDSLGKEGTPSEVSVLIVRNPPAPEVEISCAAGVVTIGAAE